MASLSPRRTSFPVIFVIMLQILNCTHRDTPFPKFSAGLLSGGEAQTMVQAQGNGRRVGDIVGLKQPIEPQLARDSVLHLLLRRLTAAGQEPLYLRRRE